MKYDSGDTSMSENFCCKSLVAKIMCLYGISKTLQGCKRVHIFEMSRYCKPLTREDMYKGVPITNFVCVTRLPFKSIRKALYSNIREELLKMVDKCGLAYVMSMSWPLEITNIQRGVKVCLK